MAYLRSIERELHKIREIVNISAMKLTGTLEDFFFFFKSYHSLPLG